MYQLTFNEAPFMICMGSTTFPRLFDIFLPCASHIMPWSITSYESQMKRSSHNISFMQKAWCKMVTWSFVSFCFKSTIFCKTPIPRKIMLSPYAKKCFVFNHIFRTKCWYWANTSTLSLSACKQSAGIGSIPALCGLIFHTFVISQFFNTVIIGLEVGQLGYALVLIMDKIQHLI